MNGLIIFAGSLFGAVSMVAVIYLAIRRTRKENKYSPFTEKSLRSPGYTLGQQLDDRRVDLLGLMLGSCFLPFLYFVQFQHFSVAQAYLFGLFYLVAWAFAVNKSLRWFKEVRKLILGLEGEVYTGQELNYLMRDGAFVYHDIPYKYGNIDHIIVSTGGVFAVETKAVRKPANEDGKRQSEVNYRDGKLHFPHAVTDAPIRQAQRHAEYLGESLSKRIGKSIPVTPVVAIPGWFVKSSMASDVLVVNPKRGNSLRGLVK